MWVISWTEQGVRCEKATGFSDSELNAAQQALTDFLNAHQRIGNYTPKQRKIADVLDDYRSEKGESIHSQVDVCVANLKSIWKNKTVDDIDQRACERYARKRNVKGSTARRELGVLAAAIAHDKKQRRLTDTVYVWKPEAGKPRDRWLTRKEANDLIDSARGHLLTFVLIGLYQGVRTQAILDLTWERIDFERDVIDFGVGNGNKRRPRTAMHPMVKQHLLSLVRESEYVVSYRNCRVGSVKKAFAQAVQRAGLSNVTPHVLRHTCVSWLVQKGVNYPKIGAYVGMSPRTIEAVYGHHDPDKMSEVIAAL